MNKFNNSIRYFLIFYTLFSGLCFDAKAYTGGQNKKINQEQKKIEENKQILNQKVEEFLEYQSTSLSQNNFDKAKAQELFISLTAELHKILKGYRRIYKESKNKDEYEKQIKLIIVDVAKKLAIELSESQRNQMLGFYRDLEEKLESHLKTQNYSATFELTAQQGINTYALSLEQARKTVANLQNEINSLKT